MRKFVGDVERSVLHYGDTTLTYLSNLQRADDAGAGARLRLGRRGRGEDGHRLQRRQPDRRPEDARRPRAAEGAAGGDLPQGGHALQRQPVRRPRRALGDRGRRRPARPTSSSTCSATPTAEAVHRRRLPHLRPRGRQADPRQRRADRRRREDRAEPAAPGRARRGAGDLDRPPQGGPRAAAARRLRLDGRGGRRRRPSWSWPRRPRSRRCRSSPPATRSGCGRSPPTCRHPSTHLHRAGADRARSATNRSASRRRVHQPRPRSTARRCTRRSAPAVTEMNASFDTPRDQRGRGADRRPQRVPTDNDLASLVRALDGGGENALRVFSIAYGDGRRPRDAEADLGGVTRRGLRRPQPGEHRQGLHRRAVQLLTSRQR